MAKGVGMLRKSGLLIARSLGTKPRDNTRDLVESSADRNAP
jgi:hypothetical protein